jgi:hypothetical protein
MCSLISGGVSIAMKRRRVGMVIVLCSIENDDAVKMFRHDNGIVQFCVLVMVWDLKPVFACDLAD